MKKLKRTERIKNPLSVSIQSELVEQCNSIVLHLKESLYAIKPPEFGSSLYSSNSADCVFHNSDTIIASLVSHRITSKFEAPSRNTESLLKRQCSSDWIAFERNHLKEYDSELRYKRVPGAIWKGAQLIEQWLGGFSNGRYRYDKSFWSYLDDAPIEFGPGESFNSSRGKSHVFNKLNPLTATVTVDALNLACLVIASNKALRNLYSEAIRRTKDPLVRAMVSHSFAYECERMEGGEVSAYRINVFARRVKAFLQAIGAVQHGSRSSSVYKDSKKRRFINIECLLNVLIQKMIASALRKCLKSNAGIDLDLGQAHHRNLIKDPQYSTVDWSNASDSILTLLIEKLFSRCKKVLRLLHAVRSPFVLVKEYDKKHTLNNYQPSIKFSSMGNGYTFELLTIVTCAIARTLDVKASSYGDDVIIRNEYAEEYIRVMTTIGFLPNLKKTFVNKPFRESCGGFFLDGYGYIRSYDFKWNHNIADVITTANKMRRILDGNPGWDHPVRNAIKFAWESIDAIVPRTLRGPVSVLDDIPSWYESKDNYLRGHRRDPYVKQQWDTYRRLAESLSVAYREPNGSYGTAFWSVVSTPQLKDKVDIQPHKDVKSMRLAYAYIYSGRITPMLVRQQKEDHKFAFKPTLVHTSGLALRAATARRIEVELLQSYRKELLEKVKLLKAARSAL